MLRLLYTFLCLVAFVFIGKSQDSVSKPEARWGHVFIYHPALDQVLLFGGATSRRVYVNETWLWDGKNWKKMNIDGPPARGFAAVSYHPERKSIMVHGGRGNNGVTFSDLWEWDGSSWQQIEQSSSFKADHHEMVYDQASGQLVAFGGWTGEGVSAETWLWKEGWTKHDGKSPPGRSAFGMTYDHDKSKVVLYGGLWINGQYADIWEWADGSWSMKGGHYDRNSLDHHELFYDSKGKTVMGFGGKNYRYAPRQETFALDGKQLSVVSGEGPSARHSTAIAHNSKSGLTYLFGGKFYSGDQQLPLGDLWVWDGKVWKRLP